MENSIRMRQSLARYDSVSLRPISTVLPVRSAAVGEPQRYAQIATFPRISAQLSNSNWSQYAADNIPFSMDEQQQQQRSVQQVSLRGNNSWPARLHRNHHISVHRMAFIFLKFPAIASLLIAAILLYGPRNVGQNLVMEIAVEEWRAGMAALGSAGLLLVSLLLVGHQNHWNSHRRTKFQTLWRVFFAFIGLILCVGTGILSAFALDQIRFGKNTDQVATENDKIVRQQRIVYFAILIGLCALELVLTAITLLHGIQAIVRIQKDRNQLNYAATPKLSAFGPEPLGVFDTQTDRY